MIRVSICFPVQRTFLLFSARTHRLRDEVKRSESFSCFDGAKTVTNLSSHECTEKNVEGNSRDKAKPRTINMCTKCNIKPEIKSMNPSSICVLGLASFFHACVALPLLLLLLCASLAHSLSTIVAIHFNPK